MTLEVEAKAWVTDYAATQAAIEAAGAEFLGESVKRDHYYGPEGKPARDIDLEKDRVFRIRTEGGKAVVTTKGREVVGDDGVEVNREVEFEVQDAASFREFAQAMGFRPFIVKRKQSRKYRLGRASVDLHRIDPLGDFIEVEILVEDPDEVKEANAEVRAILERLGIPASKIEPRRYVDLLRKIGVGRPDRGE